ncbi:glutamyl-tRNA(Gln) amidotransferase subunit B, mitochondrial isoform X2 [Phymastichus coffea]|uniref:glutamyl-tRNA(Gln) amidotransferase subunit B, mitochondrial isoform X2 n=1 Tax=Phymastichus coffea TaxID=108790 RepID=UPI00273A8FB7|nr:glutamyl-tRNA(Gln) amidotransferase subunit B, mitochondrial isoform X2 [Phymastichus coffea]
MKSFAISRCYTRKKTLKQNYSLLKRFFCSKAKEKPKSKKCVETGVLSALALSCKVNEISLFDRKHYFYADLPAGYQITQQRQPLAVNGCLNFHVFVPGVHKEPYSKSSRLKQIQLEQDSGKSLHDEEGKRSLIDLNRAGIPLMEFVFEPDLKDGEEAAALVKELMLILERLNACSCIMAEGAMRVDANVSINKPGEPLGVRTEIKNINSVRAVASAIKYEIKRQIILREKGEIIVNETRSWDTVNKKTVAMRDKEEKQDYRFMPEPNLPPLCIHVNENLENKYNLVDATLLRKQIPELPQETRNKLLENYALNKAVSIILVNEPKLLKLFLYISEKDAKRTPQFVANIIVYALLKFINDNDLDIDYCMSIRDHVCELIDFLHASSINIKIFHKVLSEVLKDPRKYPKQIIQQNKWYQINDEEQLRKIIENILDNNPDLVKKYEKGKIKLFPVFTRKVVEATKDTANVLKVEKLLKEMLQIKSV